MDLKISQLRLITDIVKTGSLSAAAKSQGLSASSASRSLKQLQAYFNDPLFVRTYKGMVPTETVQNLLPDMQQLLYDLQSLEQKKIFDPAKLDIMLTIGAADNAIVAILLPVIRYLQKMAPGMQFRLQQLGSYQFEALAQGELDFLLYPTSCAQDLPIHFKSLNLYPIRRAILLASDHPLVGKYRSGKAVTADDLCEYPRVVVKLRDNSRGSIFNVHLEDKCPCRAVIEVPYFLGAPYFLEGTQNILALPAPTADFFAAHIEGLTAIPWDTEGEVVYTRLIWHERTDSAPYMQWIRSVIKEYAGAV